MCIKRIISLLMCVVFLCSLYTVNANAQNTDTPKAEVVISTVNFVQPDEVCQINISVYNFDKISANGGKYDLKIALPKILDIVNFYKDGTAKTYRNDANVLTIKGSFGDTQEFGTVTQYTLWVKIKSTAKGGKYNITLDKTSSITDASDNEVSIKATSGFIRVAARKDLISSDANSDNKIDAEDMLITRKVLLKSINEYYDALATDGTADGNTDIRDIIYLKKNLATLVDYVYLSNNGDDRNSGNKDNPVRTLNKAIDMIKHGGIVYIVGTYTLTADFMWNHHSKSITINGGELDLTAFSVFSIGDNVTFKNVLINTAKNTKFYTNGYQLLLGKGSGFSNSINLSTSNSNNNIADITYDVALEKPSYNPLNEKIGMSFYHFYQGEWDSTLAPAYGVKESEFLNYYRIGGISDLQALKEKNALGWCLIGNPFPNRETTTFRSGWEENIIATAEAYKNMGLWDQLAGFETEEICMAVTQEQYKTLTAWLRDTFPDKRIFSCLSMYEVRGTAPAGFTIAPMSYDTYANITDIGYDWYSHLNVQQYRDAVELMLTNMDRRDNVRVWFFPTSYRFGEATTEDFCISHLNIMYDLLMDETLVKNPGGLYCYTWKSFGNGEGINELCDPERQFKWTRFGNELIRIGKEICANDYRYVRPFN